ncbi:MAG TPA: hypothetical protein VHF23_01260 [Gaiellaceae bacterium]|nr:hypothetical protein [Gaiellaceae bacterium]
MRTATIDIPQKPPETDIIRRDDVPAAVLCTAEVAECTCPEACERDHDRD